MEHNIGADIARGSRPVFNHHRLAEPLLYAVGDDARDGIDATAGWHANDDPDRSVGIIGRGVLRQCAGCIKHGSGNQNQNYMHFSVLSFAASEPARPLRRNVRILIESSCAYLSLREKPGPMSHVSG